MSISHGPSSPSILVVNEPSSFIDDGSERELLQEVERVFPEPDNETRLLPTKPQVHARPRTPDYRADIEYDRAKSLLEGLLPRAPDRFLKMWQMTLEKEAGSLMHFMALAGLDIILKLSAAQNYDEDMKWKERKYSELWRALLDGGLVEMCATFLAHQKVPQPYTIKVVSSILRQIADNCLRDVHSGRSLGALAPQLLRLFGEWWQALWRTHLHHHPSPTSVEQLSTHSESIDAMLDVVWTLSQFIRLSKNMKLRNMGGDAWVAFRRVTLLAWFMPANEVYIETGLRDQCLTIALNLWDNMQPESGFTDHDRNVFIEEDLLETYGPDMFLSRLCEVLRRPMEGRDDTHIRLHPGVMDILRRPVFHTRYVASGVLGAVRDFADLANEQKPDVNARWELHEAILDFYLVVMDSGAAINQTVKPLFQFHDIFGLLARASLYYVKADDIDDDDDGLSLIEQIVSNFTLVAGGASVHSQKERLRNGMRESLRPHWYRVIWELGRLRAYYCRATARCEKVIIAWTALGDVLRLRIADEKAAFEYEREKATLMCAWDECMYHTQRPLVTTRACKGCGEVRYCSRECQVRDWKQGHRNHCKRLKTGK